MQNLNTNGCVLTKPWGFENMRTREQDIKEQHLQLRTFLDPKIEIYTNHKRIGPADKRYEPNGLPVNRRF